MLRFRRRVDVWDAILMSRRFPYGLIMATNTIIKLEGYTQQRW